MGAIEPILEKMKGITLDEMDAIRLMNRVDAKWLTDRCTLERILEKAAGQGYFAFEFSGKRLLGYRTLYFDTPELQMYLDHQCGRLVRQKVRKRCYLASGITFLELKSKNNHGRTKKKRIEITKDRYETLPSENSEESAFLDDKLRFDSDCLSPALETCFTRITLVNPDKTERTTIDMDLSFANKRNGIGSGLGDLAVIEVKQDGNCPSPMRDILLEERVKPFRISKYCIGTAMTDPLIRKGRVKAKLIRINKMMNNTL